MKQLLVLLISLLSFCCNSASATVRILTFHFNKPDFIELQHKSFQKFLQDDFELIVFNDAATPHHEQAIRETCEKLGIQCIRFQPEWHLKDPLNVQLKEWLDNPAIYSHIGFNRTKEGVDINGVAMQPSIRHGHVIQYALDHYGYDHDDVVAIVDGDAFAIRTISLRNMLKDCDIFGIERWIAEEHVSYLWVPFIAFHPKKLPNIRDLKFHAAVIGSKLHDTGAQTWHYIKNNPTVKVKKYLGSSSTGYHHWYHFQIRHAGFTEAETDLIKTLPWPQCVEFHINNSILHFGASSFELEGHMSKADCVHQFIDSITM